MPLVWKLQKKKIIIIIRLKPKTLSIRIRNFNSDNPNNNLGDMADTTLTSEKPTCSSSLLNPPSRIICHVCQKQFSQYTCPRCNSRYCSLKCYQAHSRRCTESFMRENVVDEMSQMQSDDETKRKMLDILKRFHSEEEVDSTDEDESTLSEETIQKVLSGAQVNFDDLSADEKKLFQRAVASGELGKMIEPWEPWWLKPAARTISLSKQGTQLVQPVPKQEVSVPSDEDLESNETSEIPPGPETPLPPISKLSSTEPSPLLAVHLVDIIFSYCFTLRVYNGDWQSDALGSAMMVLSVSSILGQGGQPETIREALSCCMEQTCSFYKHMGGLQFGLAIIDGVASLLSLGSPALVCSLCDLQRLIQAGEKDMRSDKTSKLKKSEIRSKLKLAERKIYFIMCWVHEQPGEAWSSSAAILRAQKNSFTDYGGNKGSVKTESKGKIMIEEIQ